MDGKVEIWLHGILTSNPPLTWAEFTDSLALRFDDVSTTTIIAEFNKLSQTISISDYIDKFEELKGFMVSLGRNYDELYWLKEYVDDTEDYINIMLDDEQNHLLQLGVILTTATLVG
ncbi:hypothetical protein Leryth_018976 [Lithospermum erythrorhizon]|nr:hypothetical protein Leryth_018976 [Lithospermum erythrorhizon]